MMQATAPPTFPPQAAAGQLSSRLGRTRGVLPPHVPASAAPVAADRHLQHRGPPPQRLVRQPTDHTVARRALAAAAPAPLIRLDHTAGQDCPIRLKALPNNREAELIQPAERGQVEAGEGSVRHVEVFQLGGVRTPIIGRPRPLPGDPRAARLYTLNCEEPVWAMVPQPDFAVN